MKKLPFSGAKVEKAASPAPATARMLSTGSKRGSLGYMVSKKMASTKGRKATTFIQKYWGLPEPKKMRMPPNRAKATMASS